MISHDRSDTAIHHVSASGNEFRFRGSKKSGHGSDILRAAAAPHGTSLNVSLDLLRVGLVPFAGNVGGDVAGHHRVDGNSVRSQHRRHGFHQRVYASLGGTVVDLCGRSDFGGNRTDADNAAAGFPFEHHAGGFLAGEENGSQVDAVDPVPYRLVDFKEFQHGTDAGIVDQNIEPPPSRHVADQGAHGGGVGDIHLADFAVPPSFASEAECLFRRSGIPGVGSSGIRDHDVSPLARQPHRNGSADTARSARNNRRLAVKTFTGGCMHRKFLGCTESNKVHSIKPRFRSQLQFEFAYMPIPITIPKATITMEEANVVLWRKQVGEAVAKDEVLYEVETDKVIVEVPAPAAGVLLRIDVTEGLAKLGQAIGWIGQEGEAIPDVAAGAARDVSLSPLAEARASSPPALGVAAATPAARRLARELSVDLASVTGTGPGGRIVEGDVRAARRNQ